MRSPAAHFASPNYRTARQLRAAIDSLEPRRLLAGDFSINAPSSITVPAGKSYQVPITTENGDGVSFDADPSSNLTAGFRSASNPYLELATSRGTMRFQLFADVAERTVQAIRGLVDSGFYEGLSFGRVVDRDGFRIAQGGTSSRGPGFTFDDEFREEAIFDGTGQLAMANNGNDARGGKDENASTFFVTGGSARSLDFNHTIFGQLVRGADVLESILATADPGADLTVATPLSETTITGARLVGDDADAVMTMRAGSKTGTRSVVVTATDEDGHSVSRTIKVRVVPEIYATPPILALPDGDAFSAGSGSTITIPFDVLGVESGLFDARINIESGGSYVDQDGNKSRIDLDARTVIFTIKPGASGKVAFRLGVSGYNAVSRGSIVFDPGDDLRSLKIYDTQLITIAVNGTPIERTSTVGTIAARVGDEDALKDATLATFESDDDADKDDFAATINWGDGTGLDAARIERLSKGKFAVVSHDGHAYRRASSATPVTVELSGVNGTRTTVRATAVVGDPASLSSDGTLTIRGTTAGDDVRLSTEDDKLIVRAGDDRMPFTMSSVRRIVVELYDGDDKLSTVDAEGLPAMTINGGAGDDSLYGGDAADRIDGGAGDDELFGNGGDDDVYGGDGDEYILGGSGKNYLYGEAGLDRIIGGGGRDFISGGDDADRLYGRSGDDTIEGNSGTDRLYGEDGNDRMIGGSSNDRLYAGPGDDTLWGNGGSDTLNGGPGANARGDRDDDDTLIDVVG